jgi:hypothetical protein
MPRRVSLPGASELFRPTQAEPRADTIGQEEPGHREQGQEGQEGQEQSPEGVRGSGRVRHDEKITVYVSRDELLALEQARLTLRAEHAMAVDRGRIVREAIAALLEDLDRRGPDSELVRRLSPS